MNKCIICEKVLKLESICRLCKKNDFKNKNEFLKSFFLSKNYTIEYLTENKLNELLNYYLILLNKKKGENPTFKSFWTRRGYNIEQSTVEVNKFNNLTLDYWIERGYSLIESEKHRASVAKANNNYCEEFWIKKGYTKEEALIKIKDLKNVLITRTIKNVRTNNKLCIEHYIKKGFTEEYAKNKILELQHSLHKNRDMSNMKIRQKETINKKTKEELSSTYKKISDANKNNINKSPIFYQYWLNKGMSLKDAKFEAHKTKCLNSNNIVGSKVEEKFMNELSLNLNDIILRNKYVTVNKNIFCPDGKYKNFVIEFNGTNIHLDDRFHNKDSKNPYGVSFIDKHARDEFKTNTYLTKYNVIVVWEYDYNNKIDLINKIIKILKNETNKQNTYWDSKNL